MTDRPDFTESATTVPTGWPQLEFGYTISDADGATEHAVGELLLRLPLLQRLELRLGLPSWIHREGDVDAGGVGNPSVGTKLALLEPSGRPGASSVSVALLASTTLPLGAEEVDPGGAEPEIRLAATGDIQDGTNWGVNVGWTYLDADDERLHQLLGSLALGQGMGERLGSFVEIFGLHTAELDDATEAYLNGGLTYLLSPHVQVDARFGAGLTDAAGDFFGGVGAAFRW